MIRFSTVIGIPLRSTTLIGKGFDHPLDDSPKADSFNSPSMPITGLRHYTNVQPKTTVLIDDALLAEPGKKQLTMSSDAPETAEQQQETKQDQDSLTMSPSTTHQHQWHKLLCLHSTNGPHISSLH
jgi:hypothetical protein